MASKQAAARTGSISIDAQNIMPVIKRWLYSDKDIFLREIVSNGVDAVTKLKMLGKGGDEELRVVVTLDRKEGEIRVWDNGVGMTAEEMDRYINQVAFSSAEEFLKNYTGEDASGIIGHCGLGFTPRSWHPTGLPWIPCPGRTVRSPFSGPATTAFPMK